METKRETLEFILNQDRIISTLIITLFIHKQGVRKMFGGTWYNIESSTSDIAVWTKVPFHVYEKGLTARETEKYPITYVNSWFKIFKYIFAYIKNKS